MQLQNIRIRLSLLWIVVMLNMIFNDIFSIMVEIVEGSVLQLPGDVQTVMAVAAVLTNIPILMILLSWTLPHRAARIANIAAAIFTIVYVVGGGSLLPHYIIVAVIEVAVLAGIILQAGRWKTPD
ncbi:DUF6326 family protein [Spirochaeta lutea]|uniref:Uncharacterized protein n=1 Tax=Spirochaeta lutea TaxID=1480694 RepID=A0A098QWP1_9SPIO|nr:DUF6326 family protein [Spirochaeta lutea]KGE70887.1 hypothetical protein DC28_13085 [Spirochaeta lutea]